MPDFLAHLPQWLSVITVEIIGLVAVYGLFDNKYRERQREKDEQEDRIIKLYQTEVEQLKNKLDTYEAELKLLRSDISKMSGENKIMRDLLTGRDMDTSAWRERTEKSMDLTTEIGMLAVANGKKMDACLQTVQTCSMMIERLAISIEKSTKAANTST